MSGFKAGDVIVVDYPHVETNRMTRRPALVISAKQIGPDGLVLWALMITSAANAGWPGDVEIKDLEVAGLPAPSVVRTEKITTLEAAGEKKIGRVGSVIVVAVKNRIQTIFAISETRLK